MMQSISQSVWATVTKLKYRHPTQMKCLRNKQKQKGSFQYPGKPIRGYQKARRKNVSFPRAEWMNLPRPCGRGIFSTRFVGSEIPPKRKHFRFHPRAYARGISRRGIILRGLTCNKVGPLKEHSSTRFGNFLPPPF